MEIPGGILKNVKIRGPVRFLVDIKGIIFANLKILFFSIVMKIFRLAMLLYCIPKCYKSINFYLTHNTQSFRVGQTITFYLVLNLTRLTTSIISEINKSVGISIS